MKKKISPSLIVDLANGKLPPEEALRLLDRIEHTPEASSDLDFAARLADLAATEGEEVFATERELAVKRPPRSTLVALFSGKGLKWRVGFAALVATYCLVLSIMVMSVYTGSEMKIAGLALLDAPELEVQGRGTVDAGLAEAYREYARGDLDACLKSLERYIRSSPDGVMVDFAHYFAGAVCLRSAKGKRLLLFPAVDAELTARGVEHLTWAARESGNSRLVEDALWLRANGYLLNNDVKRASEELAGIAASGGARARDARNLLQTIEARRVEH